jgi:hypothetical protein
MLSLKHIQASLEQYPAMQVVQQQVAPDSSDRAVTKKHAMISYCWGTKKELAVKFAAMLKEKGVDVWRDEEGSECLPAMSGSTDDRMAAAIEHSHTIICA